MFDLCHHALAASADIGIVMEYLMEVVKKFEQKKQNLDQNLEQKSLFRGIHYLVTKDHQLFHKIQQQKIVKYWDIKPVSKEIKLQLHRFSFLLKATP